MQPLFGQMCNLFGRKSVLIFVFAAYTVGSGIAGGANEEIMLIAGRAIQGVGSGGLNMAADVVVSDLVPLRYRGNYIALLLIVTTLGFSIGPFVGGVIVENASWRWVSVPKMLLMCISPEGKIRDRRKKRYTDKGTHRCSG